MTQTPAPAQQIRPIDAQQTHPLRHRVLRPHQAVEDMVFVGDEQGASIHLGAFDPGLDPRAPVGIVSLYSVPMPGSESPGDWRLRGMAVDAACQRRGIGRLLIGSCFEHVHRRGGQRIWCNARVSAMGFYDKIGFVTHGQEFEIVGIGPHYVMSIAVAGTSR